MDALLLMPLWFLDTSTALVFRNQLKADQFLLRVELQDAQYRVQKLQQYIVDSF